MNIPCCVSPVLVAQCLLGSEVGRVAEWPALASHGSTVITSDSIVTALVHSYLLILTLSQQFSANITGTVRSTTLKKSFNENAVSGFPRILLLSTANFLDWRSLLEPIAACSHINSKIGAQKFKVSNNPGCFSQMVLTKLRIHLFLREVKSLP